MCDALGCNPHSPVRDKDALVQAAEVGMEAQMHMALRSPSGLKSTFVSPKALGQNTLQCYQVAKEEGG